MKNPIYIRDGVRVIHVFIAGFSCGCVFAVVVFATCYVLFGK